MRGHGKMKLEALQYHRNGVAGVGFHVAIATEKDGEGRGRKLIVQFSDDPLCTAVFDLDKLAAGDIGFGSNSWRGDVYSGWMLEQCEKDEL